MMDNAEGKDMAVDKEGGPRRKKLRQMELMELMREEGLRKGRRWKLDGCGGKLQ